MATQPKVQEHVGAHQYETAPEPKARIEHHGSSSVRGHLPYRVYVKVTDDVIIGAPLDMSARFHHQGDAEIYAERVAQCPNITLVIIATRDM